MKPPVALTLIAELADPPGVAMGCTGWTCAEREIGHRSDRQRDSSGLARRRSAEIVTVDVPPGVAPVVEIVRVSAVDVPGVTGLGLNKQLAPAGRPEQVRFTAPGDPFTAASVRAYEAESPAVTVALVGGSAVML